MTSLFDFERVIFLTILGVLKVVLELFRKCLVSIIFVLQRPTFGYILSSKGRLINPDFQSKFDPLLTFESVVFSYFGDRKSCIFDFSRLFGNCFCKLSRHSFWHWKRPSFYCIFSSQGLYLILNFEIFSQNISHFDRFEGSLLAIFGFRKVVSGLFESYFRFAQEVFRHPFWCQKTHF